MAVPVKVWNRKSGRPTSKPDCPPSPIILLSHLLGFPVVCQVPLSCVPPCSRLVLNGLTDRLWNCSVLRPLFRPSSLDGIRESICRHRSRAAPDSCRFGSSHHADRLTNSPDDRMTPPSLVSKNCNGLLGLTTRSCWSGCRPFGCSMSVPSNVMSVPVTPASVDRTTARLFATVCP